eukprot:scaffold15973_cov137-Isochrysis_galbana.AAC.3
MRGRSMCHWRLERGAHTRLRRRGLPGMPRCRSTSGTCSRPQAPHKQLHTRRSGRAGRWRRCQSAEASWFPTGSKCPQPELDSGWDHTALSGRAPKARLANPTGNSHAGSPKGMMPRQPLAEELAGEEATAGEEVAKGGKGTGSKDRDNPCNDQKTSDPKKVLALRCPRKSRYHNRKKGHLARLGDHNRSCQMVGTAWVSDRRRCSNSGQPS